MLPPKKIDPHRLVALVRREMGLKERDDGPPFPTPFGETPIVPGAYPSLDDDPWPPKKGGSLEEP